MTNLRRSTLILVALLTAGCADFATEPDRTPTELRVTPDTVLLSEGDTARFQVEVLDQNGEPFEHIPTWSPPFWVSADADRLTLDGAGLATAIAPGPTQTQVSLAGLETSATVRVNPLELALTVPFVYVTQSVQRQDGDVPLIAGREGLLRVYVQGGSLNFFRPTVRATFHSGGAVVHTMMLELEGDGLPNELSEGDLALSFDGVVPGTVIQPGVSLTIEVDPDGIVPSTPSSVTRVPATGTMALDVRAVPPLRIVMVPVHQSQTGRTSNLSTATLGHAIDSTLAMFPLSDVEVEIRASYTTSANLTTDAGWFSLIADMAFLRQSDAGMPREQPQLGEHAGPPYYYGGFARPTSSGIAGLGYVGYPVAIGWDDAASVIAHEIGHNFSLPHAPCGGPSGPDGEFPYRDGRVGHWGYDRLEEELQSPLKKDLMTYCDPVWISDYNYERVLAYRDTSVYDQAFASSATASPPPASAVTRTLVVQGGVLDGELLLGPALPWEGAVSMPASGGRYTLQGLDAGGQVVFSIDFEPRPLDHGNAAQFLMAIPADVAQPDRLAALRLTGPEGSLERGRSPVAPSARPEVRLEQTAARGTAGLRGSRQVMARWDATTFPMAVVTDRETGLIRAISRTGQVALPDDDTARYEVVLSDGIGSREARVVRP